MEAIKIDKKGKYLLLIDRKLLPEEFQRVINAIQDWWENDEIAFLILDDAVDVRLEKVDKDEN